ncbi:hypothetical protein RF11_09953 [Thelohanellus kitauei]|uniref:Uncharacterized protein n=1 Tax=Thelohanellus kitauei TaxID=669202 RepID=A0A0C2N544_THEKT|nr:hypothetical protein RF11_09953 [Thelohanellus kitauei]
MYQREGRIDKLSKGGKHRAKFTDEQKESLCDILEEDFSPTIQRICDLRDDPQNALATRQYGMNFLRIAPYRKKKFIDETGFQVKMICLYGQEITGYREKRIVLALRSRNYSVACTNSCR